MEEEKTTKDEKNNENKKDKKIKISLVGLLLIIAIVFLISLAGYNYQKNYANKSIQLNYKRTGFVAVEWGGTEIK